MTRSRELTVISWLDQGKPVTPLRIALVNMPWGRTHTPSIQCGLLKAGLTRHGHEVDVRYGNLDLSARLGPDQYDVFAEICGDRITLLSEWLFTVAAFGEQDDTEYFEKFPAALLEMLHGYGVTVDRLRQLRSETLPAWLDELAAQTSWGEYDLVGFTSTFEQNVSSLALAKRLKERHPGLSIVCGGANFDADMGPEFAKAFRFIDYAVSGEGDLILPVIAARLSEGRSALGLPGVSGWDGDTFVSNGQAPKVEQMDVVPEPDYTDYFEALERLGQDRVLGRKKPILLYESSRGCWWGEKHHCTFCGLNANGMAYRSKSPDQVTSQLKSLAEKYRVLSIQTVDNILDMHYLSSVCEKLGDERLDLNLFYEVKANLSRDQLRTLHRAGLRSIQPGVESLSSHVLGLMRKGSTMLTNVRVLKWSRYYGFKVIWNILVGFPGESDDDYDQQADLVPSLTHLEPPDGVGRLWLERFSPYFTGDYPIHDVHPADAYRFVYPDTGIDMEKIAYFFDYRAEEVGSDQAYARLVKSTDAWQQRWSEGRVPRLDYERGPSWLSITDTRGERPLRITIRSWSALAYEACEDKPHNTGWIAAYLEREHGMSVAEEQVAAFLEKCVEQRLMVSEDGKYLALALPRNRYW